VALLKMAAPGCRVVGGLADQRATGRNARATPIALPLEWLNRKLGRQVDEPRVTKILESLGFGVTEASPGLLSVTVPSWRATRDVSIKDDLVEEVGRMVGYDSIVPAAPLVPSTAPPASPRRMFLRHVRALVAAQGFTEVSNYSFLSDQTAREFQLNPDDHVRVANPISEEQGLLRTTLVPGIRKNIRDNARHFESFRLFEIGREIHQRPEGLPDEITHLAAAVYARDDGQAGLFELKRLAECLMPGCEVRPAAARPWEHPARAADLVWRGITLGRLFEFHPSMVEGRGAVLDVDLDEIERLQPQPVKYTPSRRYPSSAFDLSVVVGLRELVAGVRKRLCALAGEALESIEFVRLYIGAPLAEGRKSVSFRLTVAARDRTLSSEEVGAIRTHIIEGMRAAGHELRL